MLLAKSQRQVHWENTIASLIAGLPLAEDRKMHKTLRYFWPFIAPIKYRYFFAMVVTIPIGLIDGLVPWLMQPLLDGLSSGKLPADLSQIPFLIIMGSLLQGLLIYGSTYSNAYIGSKLVQSIRKKMFDQMLKIKVEALQTLGAGHFVNRVYNDPQKAQSVLLVNPRIMIGRFASIGAITFVMLSLNAKLCFIALLVSTVLIIPMSVVRNKVIKAARQEHGMIGNIMGLINSTIGGIKLVQSYQLKSFINKRLEKMHQFLFNKAMSITKAEATLSPISYVVTGLGIGIILMLSVGMIQKGELTTGGLVAFVASLLMLYRPMRNIGTTLVQYQKDAIALERIEEFLENKDWLMPNYEDRKVVDKLEKHIKFENVRFRYENRPEVEVLKSINLTIEAGKVFALIGRSGSGKTTLAEILMGMFPDTQIEGRLLFDDTPIQELNLHSIQRLMSYVSQDTVLFDGTLEENIRLGKLDATEEELAKAVENAQLKEFIESLPDGLATAVGERGSQLSGGQRQRVAIARAFLHNSPILILDEATSALDNEAEVAIQAALDELMVGRTTLVIAHRLSTVQYADQIVVLDKGQIVEQGKHQALLDQKGLYYLLYNAQSFRHEKRLQTA